jgi:hypothetical protein
MSGPRDPTVKNIVVTGGAKRQGYLGVSRPMEGVRPLATVEMTDHTVKAVDERGVRCRQTARVAA